MNKETLAETLPSKSFSPSRTARESLVFKKPLEGSYVIAEFISRAGGVEAQVKWNSVGLFYVSYGEQSGLINTVSVAALFQ
ncbi:hypothetical protein ACO22_07913 [Paracoccidioides brasiliensis]|uniref:Uncharacterized protein n=1 Tax=Paracoccidioides brasiliensis TaxID=121759 RepID=A0A1D2J3B4_PARBR|nr:hypothetical protein ACO22_07913 [Paracoccidioides brasiliensis]